MKTLLRLSPLFFTLALVGMTQLSCSVNDYCLNCEKGDGGHGSGDGGTDGNGSADANVDAGCVPTGGPEECNGKDDDCNGLVDDNVQHEGEACDNVIGACAGGTKICQGGTMKCTKSPSPEVCDGIDNNCSGPVPGNSSGIDEGDPGPPLAVGAPETGSQCGNGTDDDGDGVKDDGCPGTGGKCGTDAGECTAGQYHCSLTTHTVECLGSDGLPWAGGQFDHTGATEACNGKDDDCDGNFDEDITFSPSTCGPATNTGACEFGTKACQAGLVVCLNAVFPAFDSCNNVDDDCDGVVDQNTNKDIDVQNCGYCGDICPTITNANNNCTVKTRPAVGTPETQCGDGIDNDSDGTKDDGCTEGTCGFTCQPGYYDLDGDPSNGCEYGQCFPTGVDATHPNGTEICDGIDNDCDNKVDAMDPDLEAAPALCFGKGECGPFHGNPTAAGYTVNTPPAPTCDPTAKRWVCNYAAGYYTTATPTKTVQLIFPGTLDNTSDPRVETLCDGLDNNCDGNIDEYQQTSYGHPIGATCHEDRETICNDMIDNDQDGFVNDGCPAVGAPETNCDEAIAVDDDGDGVFNDGCPAKAQLGACQGTGQYKCDPLNPTGDAYCNITTSGASSKPEECNNVDDDCDGVVDDGGATGNLTVGQDWITLGNGHQMMKYEASRPDASRTTAGTVNALVCSKPDALPWTNVKYEDALAACQSIGAQLCSETQWHHACSVSNPMTPAAYPISFSGTATYIEAEDYSSIGVGLGTTGSSTSVPPSPGRAEVGAECTNAVDDDGDGVVNDGCPITANGAIGVGPETMCNDKVDSDGDGTVNDGCPAYGPAPETSCTENPSVAPGALDDDNDGVINDGCPVLGTAEVNCRDGIDDDGDGRVNDGCPAVGPTWVPDYTTGFSGVSAMQATPNIGVSLTAAQAVTNGARLDYAINFTTAGTYHVWVKLNANTQHDENGDGVDDFDHAVFVGVKDGSGATIVPPQLPTLSANTGTTTNSWKWVEAGTGFTVTAGVRYVSVYMAEDGVKIDRIYLINNTNTSPAGGEVVTPPGNIWAYASSPNSYQPNTCNGHDYQQFTISTVSRANTGLVTVTTTTPHAFVVGDLVQILNTATSGTCNTTCAQSFEGTYTIKGVGASTFTYQQNSVAIQNTTGGTATEAKDPVLPTGTFGLGAITTPATPSTSCYAALTAGNIYDMSGNAREWTLAHSTGENPIRGGASNGTKFGISCGLNFTLADDTFFFPNIGFRCCR